MIPHVLLADGSLTIMLPTGPITRTKFDFNYFKLLSLLQSDSIDDILPLLDKPHCPNGVFHLYHDKTKLYVNHISRDSNTYLYFDNGKWHSTSTDITKSQFGYLGIHDSLESIYSTFPEYFI